MQPATTTTVSNNAVQTPPALERAQTIWDSLALAGDRVRQIKGQEFNDVMADVMRSAVNTRAAKYGIDSEALAGFIASHGCQKSAANSPDAPAR